MADNPDHDAIIHEAVHGCALRDIARSHDLTVAEVRKIIDEEAALAFSGEQLRREWLLEARRLRELGQKYFSRAMTGDDTNSAAIFIKASERLATLTGMNAPIGHAVQVIHATAPPAGANVDRANPRCHRSHSREAAAQAG
jgi:hypothetical protein